MKSEIQIELLKKLCQSSNISCSRTPLSIKMLTLNIPGGSSRTLEYLTPTVQWTKNPHNAN
jgi:hypothetical protein